MRGTPALLSQTQGLPGIIPADAGNTLCSCHRLAERRDHPRGCGEHIAARLMFQGETGSSPRMRGTRSLSATPIRANRIIPADAGNTSDVKDRWTKSQDHPRGCGEHQILKSITVPSQGSSPRMRGTLPPVQGQGSRLRIIPADAGNTFVGEFATLGQQDHPRGCGEHRFKDRLHRSLQGSSPRMRGTRRLAGLAVLPPGIIPADAGNTFSRESGVSSKWDHPRGCGEHLDTADHTLFHTGSSPRMRGTPYVTVIIRLDTRIIPADAGNTFLSFHPRIDS